MRIACAALALLIATPASAEMSIATFIAKADALKAKGMLAMMSSDVGLLRGEMKTVTTAYRADLQASRTAGKTPHSCPPPQGKAQLGSDELLAHLRSYPAPQRPQISVKTAFYAMMKKRYPCPA